LLKICTKKQDQKLTSKSLPMCFNSRTFLFLFLAYGFFKTRNYVADSNAHICLSIHSNSGFVLADKRVLNPNSYRYVVANGMSAASAVSQSLENIIITKQQCSSKIVSQFVFKEHDFNAVL